jgi:hypothetical protein
MTSTVRAFAIKNGKLPLCIQCKYFIEHKSPDRDQLLGRCKRFAEMDLVTGIIEYRFAKICRDDNSKCGTYGLEYKNKSKLSSE